MEGVRAIDVEETVVRELCHGLQPYSPGDICSDTSRTAGSAEHVAADEAFVACMI